MSVRFLSYGKRPRVRALLSLGLLVLVLGFSTTPSVAEERSSDPIDLSADVAALSVRPCLPQAVTLGITNTSTKAMFVDVVVTGEQPLLTSKPGLSTYVPAQGTVYTSIRVDAMPEAADGTYDVVFTTGRRERLAIPVTVVNPTAARCLPRGGMTASATSAQVIPDSKPANAIDGNPATLWHTRYSPVRDVLPQSITLELGGTYDVAELVYEPRPTGSANGTVTQYVLYGSADGQTFTKVGEGTWANDRDRKTATVNGAGLKYVRLEVVAGVGGYGSAAEIILYGKPS